MFEEIIKNREKMLMVNIAIKLFLDKSPQILCWKTIIQILKSYKKINKESKTKIYFLKGRKNASRKQTTKKR